MDAAKKANRKSLLILTLLMFITAAIVFVKFLIGKELFIFADIGSDTKDVYYPFFNALSRKLADGDFSMIELTYGFGTNILTRQADVGSPFTWLLVLGSEKFIQYAIVLVHILKVVLSGYVCYFYLKCFKFSNFSRVIVAYIFAFNGFTMLWGQHYFFGIFCLYLIFLLFAIEKAFQNKKYYALVAFATFLMMFTSFYVAYMGLIFAAVYSVARLIYIYSFGDIKKIISAGFKLLASVILGAIMSAALFLPSVYFLLTGSSRLESDVSIFGRIFGTGVYDNQSLFTIVSRFFSNNILGTRDYVGFANYYEAPEYFFTSFILFFAVIFVIQCILSKESLKSKVIKLIATALVLYLCFFPHLSVFLNGCAYPFFRYGFLLMPVFALMFAHIIDKILKRELVFGSAQILISTGISLTVLSGVILITNHASPYIRGLGFVFLIMTAILGMICVCLQNKDIKDSTKRLCMVLLGLLIMSNVIAESYATNNFRDSVTVKSPNVYEAGGSNDVHNAIEYVKEIDKGFYRVDKTNYDLAIFNDSMLQDYYPASVYNSVVNKNVIEFANVLCPDFEFQEGYYNFGTMYEHVEIADAMGVKYIISRNEITNVKEYELLKQFGSVYLYRNTVCDGIAQLYGSAIRYQDYLSRSAVGLKDGEIILDTDEIRINGNGKGSVDFDNPQKSSLIKGTVNSETDNYLHVALPYENGWTAYVDGEQVEIINANVALSAIEMPAGEHEVEFRYSTPLLKEGLLISLVGFAVFIGWLICMAFARKRKV